MVEILVDPALDAALDLGEIHQHPLGIQGLGFERDQNAAVVAVEVPAFPIVIDQAVTIAERDLASDSIHLRPSIRDGRGTCVTRWNEPSEYIRRTA